MISKSAAIGWARQLRIEQVVDIIIDSKRQYRSDDDSAVAIRTSARLARAIAASNKERTSGNRLDSSSMGSKRVPVRQSTIASSSRVRKLSMREPGSERWNGVPL